MNDKHRVELSFLGRMLHLIMLGAISMPNKEAHNNAVNLAFEVAKEPLAGLPDAHIDKLMRRVYRMHQLTVLKETGVTDYSKNAIAGEALVLSAYAFIENLVQQGYICMPADSLLAQLMDALLNIVDTESEAFPLRHKNGIKKARQWLQILQNEGYYQGATHVL